MYGRGDHIPHLALFQVLAELPNEHCAEWRLVSATLLCLRAVDTYIFPSVYHAIEDPDAPPRLDGALRAVDAIEASDPARESLRGILHSLATTSVARRPAKVYHALVPFGRLLQSRAMWRVAADVYHTAARYGAFTRARSVRHDRLATLLHLAECHRQLAEWDEAEAIFARAVRSALYRGDLAMALRTQCYRAAMAVERGRLAFAEEKLRTVEADAGQADLPDIAALAAHGRAHVAFNRGDFEESARLAFLALQGLPDPAARDRALADLAAAFAELGVRAAARDAHLIVAATGQDAVTRWTALINLMEIAALDGMREPFEQYRRELAAVPLPPRLAGYYRYYAGLGAHAFGALDDARAELAHAVEIGRAAKIEHLVGDAGAALHALDAGRAPLGTSTPRAPTAGIAGIADALERMRHAVDSGAP